MRDEGWCKLTKLAASKLQACSGYCSDIATRVLQSVIIRAVAVSRIRLVDSLVCSWSKTLDNSTSDPGTGLWSIMLSATPYRAGCGGVKRSGGVGGEGEAGRGRGAPGTDLLLLRLPPLAHPDIEGLP